MGTRQWITIFNAHKPKKQRYYFNVINCRSNKHFKKGNKDGLFISCVGCCQKRWAFVMDSVTNFTSQIYLINDFFLPKYWIITKWEKEYYITAVKTYVLRIPIKK